MTSIEKLQELVKKDIPFQIDYSSRVDRAISFYLHKPDAEYENIFSTVQVSFDRGIEDLFEFAKEVFPEKFPEAQDRKE